MRSRLAARVLPPLLVAALLILPLAGCGPRCGPSGKATDIVHVTKTGKRYHCPGCQSLSRSDIPITRAKAEQRGLTPCKVCKP